MLDPRIYRTGFVAVALAVVVLAFSLTDQAGPLPATLAPDAFNPDNAYATMGSLAKTYPDRRPGSFGDEALGTDVAKRLDAIQGWNVSTTLTNARTIDGMKKLETVTAVRAGQSPGAIVIVAHRDALTDPAKSCRPGAACAPSQLSGTATLLELARVLAGQTQHRTIVLASTSGSDGAAGATALTRRLGEPIDAVIVLGDLAGATVREPIVVPWSNGQDVAPPMLRNTVAATLNAQAARKPGGTTLAAQFARLAFPWTLTEQGPFGARGDPAVLISTSSERVPAPDEPVSHKQIGAFGRTVLQSINALDGGSEIPAATPYLLYDGKVVPAWAIRLFVLALMLPVFGATIDGLARARRRGQSITRWTLWVLAGSVPFLLALGLALAAQPVGLISQAPPGPLAAGAVPLHGGGVAVLVLLALVIALSFYAFRPLIIRLARIRYVDRDLLDPEPRGAAGVAVLLVMCAVAFATWLTNPFAAALMVPALHLWMWIVDPEVRLRGIVTVALLFIGLAAPVLLVLYYANALGLGPVQVAWNGLLLVAGGHIKLLAAIEWSVMLGCVASVLVIAVRGQREPRAEDLPITVRGPITYAGPGSLGGTESALRR
jgi:Peptidase family M28